MQHQIPGGIKDTNVVSMRGIVRGYHLVAYIGGCD
jgi:hypothetical protein